MWPTNADEFVSLPKEPQNAETENSLYFVFLKEDLLSISENGIPRPITSDEFRWLDVDVNAKLYLGEFETVSCYALSAEGTVPEGYSASGLRSWLGRVKPSLFYLAGRAKQILDWDRSHTFCGRCGSETRDHDTDRAKRCDECGLISYPKLSPSIIVLVRRGEEALLARNEAWPTGMFSTLAGFVEPGESIEQTVHREVSEEVGIRVKNIHFLGSQSWPFPNSLMLGFHADYDSGEIVCQEGEIAEAEWFKYDNLPNVPGNTAISGWLIKSFIDEMNKTRH